MVSPMTDRINSSVPDMSNESIVETAAKFIASHKN